METPNAEAASRLLYRSFSTGKYLHCTQVHDSTAMNVKAQKWGNFAQTGGKTIARKLRGLG
jgi:hypothetical protein